MSDAFVIHLHAGGGPVHYDLMLPGPAALATWRLEVLPCDLPAGGSTPAVRIADHRLAFLTYEGALRGGKGTVRRVDEGACQVAVAEEAIWEFRLAGRRCRGRFELRRPSPRTDCWCLTRLAGE